MALELTSAEGKGREGDGEGRGRSGLRGSPDHSLS